MPDRGEDRVSSWHLYPLRTTDESERDALVDRLREVGIGASVHFIPLHLHSWYRDQHGYAPEDLPVALEDYRCELSLPIWSGMSDADVDRVIAALA